MGVLIEARFENGHRRYFRLSEGGKYTVGRAPEATLQLPHASVAPRHAELLVVGGEVLLRETEPGGAPAGGLPDRGWKRLRGGPGARLGDVALRQVPSGDDEASESTRIVGRAELECVLPDIPEVLRCVEIQRAVDAGARGPTAGPTVPSPDPVSTYPRPPERRLGRRRSDEMELLAACLCGALSVATALATLWLAG
jgi:hypothetical protein